MLKNEVIASLTPAAFEALRTLFMVAEFACSAAAAINQLFMS